MVEKLFFVSMIKDKEQAGSKTYKCEECGLWYKNKEISEQCQAWCKEHKSCNLEIIKHSIKNMTNNNSQKGFMMPIIIAIAAVVLVLGGVVFYANRSETTDDKMAQEKAMMEQKEKDAMMAKENDAMMQKDGETMMEKKDEGAMMDKGETMMKYSGTVLAGKSAPLLDFTKVDYNSALNSDKLLVLYFYANWCPTCKAEFPVMQGAFNELTTSEVIGFRVNYNDDQTDTDEKNLAREFGVAYQHTKVFVKNGQRILKSPESWDDKRYDMEINKALTQ